MDRRRGGGIEFFGLGFGIFALLSYDAAATLAPLGTAHLFDRRGSYTAAFVLNAALPCAALAAMALAVDAPRHQTPACG